LAVSAGVCPSVRELEAVVAVAVSAGVGIGLSGLHNGRFSEPEAVKVCAESPSADKKWGSSG
jgi:hypothetical protein